MATHTEYNLVEDVKSMDPITRKGLGLGVTSGGLGGTLAVAGMATSGTAATASLLLTVSAVLSGGLVAIPIAAFVAAKVVRKVNKKRQLKKLAQRQ